jgi:hypothetical protein
MRQHIALNVEAFACTQLLKQIGPRPITQLLSSDLVFILCKYEHGSIIEYELEPDN